MKHGMLVRVARDNIMMSPPFIMTPEEVDEVKFSDRIAYFDYFGPINSKLSVVHLAL